MRKVLLSICLFVFFALPSQAAIPTFVAAGTTVSGTGNVTPGIPAGAQADDIFLLFASTPNQVVAVPTGWAEAADSPQGSGTAGAGASTRITVLWRRATGSDTAPTLTDNWDNIIAVILAFRGCITTGDPWDVTAGDTGTSSTSVSVPGDTTTVADCLIVIACSHTTDSVSATPQFSNWANADLANVTERIDASTDSGNGSGFGITTGEKASAGAYGATTATLATASAQGRMSIALKPESAAGGCPRCGDGFFSAVPHS